MVMSPQVSWLFFKARAKRPYLSHTGRASRKKQPTGRGPEGCVENGPAAALLVGYVSIEICALLAPCRRPILNATTPPLYARRCTKPHGAKAGAFAYVTACVSSIIKSRLYLANRSDCVMDPTLMKSPDQPTARSASQLSSVSPLRALTATFQPASLARR